MKIYLGHAISGLDYKSVEEYYTETNSYLTALGYEVLHPMTAKGTLCTEKVFKSSGYTLPVTTDKAITRRDIWMVLRSDITYINFEGTVEKSAGMIAELTAGYITPTVHTIITLPKDNIHYHAFILQMADIVFDSHDETLDYLLKLIRKEL